MPITNKHIKISTISLYFSITIWRTENCLTHSSQKSPGDGSCEQTDGKSSEWRWTKMMMAHSAVPSPTPLVTWDDHTSTWRVAGLHILLGNTSESFRNSSKKKSYNAKSRLWRDGKRIQPQGERMWRSVSQKLTINLLVTRSKSARVPGMQCWTHSEAQSRLFTYEN